MTQPKPDKLTSQERQARRREELIEMLWTLYVRQEVDTGKSSEDAFQLADQKLARRGLS